MAEGNAAVCMLHFKAHPYIIVPAFMKQDALSETILPTYPGIYLGIMKQKETRTTAKQVYMENYG